MKYSNNNKPIECIMTNSTCYKGSSKFAPKGVLWHSTGANNPNVSRYVQPYETDANYSEMINLLGKNRYKNDWNHQDRQAGVNAFIGKLADGTVASVQTLPYDYRPWGCGSGSKGSLNSTHLQFEICEDNLTDRSYFNKAYEEACELTAYYCKLFNLDPMGTFVYNGVTVPVITSHKESHTLKLGSNHGDPIDWFNKHGKTMDDVRRHVAELMGKKTEVEVPNVKEPVETTAVNLKIGDEVKLVSGAKYTSVSIIPNWLFSKTLYAREIRANGDIVISTLKTGAVTGVVNSKYLTKNGQSVSATSQSTNTNTNANTASTELKIGDTVALMSGATYSNGQSIPSWVFTSTLYVREIRADGNVVISKLQTGAVTGVVNSKYLTKNGHGVSVSTPAVNVQPAELSVGDTVKLVSGAKYSSGQSIPSWLFNKTLYAREIRTSGDIVISTLKTGAVTGVVNKKYLTRV